MLMETRLRWPFSTGSFRPEALALDRPLWVDYGPSREAQTGEMQTVAYQRTTRRIKFREVETRQNATKKIEPASKIWVMKCYRDLLSFQRYLPRRDRSVMALASIPARCLLASTSTTIRKSVVFLFHFRHEKRQKRCVE